MLKVPSKQARRRYYRIAGVALAASIVVSSSAVVSLRWVNPPTTMFMLLDSSRNERKSYLWTDWDEIGDNAPLAVIASEDQKFPFHFGFDVDAIRESLEDRAGGRLRGASTITQQVAKNLFLWPGRSFVRKALEAYFAFMIELTWSKRRILEVYLNVAEFGPGVFGVGAASRVYFAKSPASLTEGEAALLAAVLPNPQIMHVDRPSLYVRDRSHWILKYMRRLRRDRTLDGIK